MHKSETVQKSKILAKDPSNYNFLNNQPSKALTKQAKREEFSEQYWPKRKNRVVPKFCILPFPHNEMIDVALPDPKLKACQFQSTKRREAYPRHGETLIRNGLGTDILAPNYCPVSTVHIKDGRLVLPQPSLLQKSISVCKYNQLVERELSSQNQEPISRDKSTSSVGYTDTEYYLHGRGEFSDFDQLMIQKPVIIYLQQKKEKKG
jgi:hypothetical protein